MRVPPIYENAEDERGWYFGPTGATRRALDDAKALIRLWPVLPLAASVPIARRLVAEIDADAPNRAAQPGAAVSSRRYEAYRILADHLRRHADFLAREGFTNQTS